MAALLCLLRYLQQGGANRWSKVSMRLYVPDPDLGWRQLEEGVPWLGQDGIAAMLVLSAGLLFMAVLLRHRPGLQRLLWLPAALSLALPLWAFAGGTPASGGRATRPSAQPTERARGIRGHLEDLPAGRYELVDHEDTALIANVEAGGERFDAHFEGGLEGEMSLDPTRLDHKIQAHFSATTSSLRTQLEDRDEHARGYLQAESHPLIRLRLSRLLGTSPAQGNSLSFTADASLQLMGKTHPVRVDGILSSPPQDARMRLGLPAGSLLMLTANTELDLADTNIKEPEELFDSLDAHIHVTLFLRHQPEPSR